MLGEHGRQAFVKSNAHLGFHIIPPGPFGSGGQQSALLPVPMGHSSPLMGYGKANICWTVIAVSLRNF